MSKSIIINGLTKKGLGLGKKLGFPTLNLDYEGESIGVFAGKVVIADREYIAAVNLGGKPTISDGWFLCEAFLLDFAGEIPEGSEVVVTIEAKIRDIKKFPDLDSLKRQIARDVEFVKKYYKL